MTELRPKFQPKRLLRASLLAVGIIAGSFLIMAVGRAVIVVAFAVTICWVFYVIALANYRPKPSKWAGLTAMAIGIATLFPANIGSHSLWLTAHGETLHCNVISIETHPARTSPTTYSSKLRCGDREADSDPTTYQAVRKPGTKMDIIVDRTGFVPNLEFDKVGLGHNLLLLLAVLMNGVFIYLVAWIPLREPVPTIEDE